MRFDGLTRHWQKAAVLLAFGAMSWNAAWGQDNCTAVVGEGVQEQILFAGQTIEAGTVTLEVLETDLIVTYRTIDDWELTEAHLWVGDSLNELPQTRNGNPKVGRFPYNSGDITGETEFSFIVPLAELEFTCPGDDTDFFAAAHAALQRPDGEGGFQTETGWADGERIVPRGNWATVFQFTLSCQCDGDGGGDGDGLLCEPAYAFGETELDDIPDLVNGGTITDHFGWQIGPVDSGVFNFAELFAGAGGNDTTVAENVGLITYEYALRDDQCVVDIFYDTSFSTSPLAPWFLQETNVYVGTTDVQTGAPSEFGNSNLDLPAATIFDFHSIVVSSGVTSCEPVFIVAHAQACYQPAGGGDGGDDGDDGGGGGGGGELPPGDNGPTGTGDQGSVPTNTHGQTDNPGQGHGHGQNQAQQGPGQNQGQGQGQGSGQSQNQGQGQGQGRGRGR